MAERYLVDLEKSSVSPFASIPNAPFPGAKDFEAFYLYTKDTVIFAGGILYRAKISFRSGDIFNLADWEAVTFGELQWGKINGDLSNQNDLTNEFGLIKEDCDNKVSNVQNGLEQTNANLSNLQEDFNDWIEKPVTDKKPVTLIIGNADAGHTADEVDFLVPANANNAHTIIQNAINALPANGGKIVIREGNYNMWGVGFLLNKPNTHFEGMGSSTILNAVSVNINAGTGAITVDAPNCTITKIHLTSAANLCVGVIINNTADNTTISKCTISNKITDTAANNTHCFGIRFNSHSNKIINNIISCSSRRGQASGIIYQNSYLHNNIISENLIDITSSSGNGGYCITCWGNENVISNNKINGVNIQSSCTVYGHKNIISENIINTILKGLNGHSLCINAGSNNVISKNIINTIADTVNTLYGIAVGDKEQIITDNQILCTGGITNIGISAYQVTAGFNCTICNNTVANKADETTTHLYGIELKTGDIIVQNNRISTSKNNIPSVEFAFAFRCNFNNNRRIFMNNHIREAVTNGCQVYTQNGTTATALPGSSTTAAVFGNGGVAGFNIV